jgi:hypothetical protein
MDNKKKATSSRLFLLSSHRAGQTREPKHQVRDIGDRELATSRASGERSRMPDYSPRLMNWSTMSRPLSKQRSGSQSRSDVRLFELVQLTLRFKMLKFQPADFVWVERGRTIGIFELKGHLSSQKSEGIWYISSFIRRATSCSVRLCETVWSSSAICSAALPTIACAFFLAWAIMTFSIV